MKGKRVLTNWLDSYMEYTEEAEPPQLYKYWTGVSAICSAMKRKCYSKWEKRIYPNMFIILVGPPGVRKGTAMGFSRDIMEALGIKIAAEALTREALIVELHETQELVLNEESKIMQTSSSLTVFSEEFTVFLGQNNWVLMSDLCNWFDCPNTWKYRTKNSGEFEVVGVWLNLIGATTPDYLASALPQDAIGGGLASRIIFVYGDRKYKVVPLPIQTPEELKLKGLLIRDLEMVKMLNGEFKVSEDYSDLYVEWYKAQESNPPFQQAEFQGYNERRALHLRKLSMVMSAARGDDMILSEDDFIRSHRLLKKTEESMKFVFHGRGRNPQKPAIEKILKHLPILKELSYQKLVELTYNDLMPDELEKVIKSITGLGVAVEVFDGRTRVLKWIGRDEKKEGSS